MDHLVLLTIQETCDILRIKKSKLYEMMRGGEIPFIKVRQATRFEKDAIAAYIDSRRIGRRPPKREW
jgi:excisionase family DNA binding protein